MADNEKRIAEIDSQLRKPWWKTTNALRRLTAKSNSVEFKYQVLRAPVSGTVFDLQAHAPGFVTNSNALLKVVPDDAPAKVFISNQDIGFVKKG